MADEKVTPIRPGVSINAKSKRLSRRERDEARIKDRLHDFQFRIGRASALAKALALACDGQVMAFGIEPTEGCLGVAELLDSIQGEMYDLSQSKTVSAE
jgi:hypothetical protein